MNISEITILKNEIEEIEKIHHLKIFKIIKNNNIKYSENRNGIFINMNSFDKKTINEIKDTLLYIKEQEKHLKDIENLKKEINKDYFNKNNKAVKENLVSLNNNASE